MYDNKYFYVLSIGVDQKTWAPYLFIDKLSKVYLLLTQNGIMEREGKDGCNWSMSTLLRKTIQVFLMVFPCVPISQQIIFPETA